MFYSFFDEWWWSFHEPVSTRDRTFLYPTVAATKEHCRRRGKRMSSANLLPSSVTCLQSTLYALSSSTLTPYMTGNVLALRPLYPTSGTPSTFFFTIYSSEVSPFSADFFSPGNFGSVLESVIVFWTGVLKVGSWGRSAEIYVGSPIQIQVAFWACLVLASSCRISKIHFA